MDLFRRKRSFLPIEVMLALAINVVVIAFGYCAVLMWGLLSR
jgi:hypothetical protein